nr:MAG TPA: hypothetical protein [Caudoviricetes sp.]
MLIVITPPTIAVAIKGLYHENLFRKEVYQ